MLVADSNGKMKEHYGYTSSTWEEMDIYVTAPEGATIMYVNNHDVSVYHAEPSVSKVLNLEYVDYNFGNDREKISAVNSYFDMKYIWRQFK